jgi:twitching motility protein PilU
MERDQASKFINDLLKLMVSRNGSDLFITGDFPPAMKVDGKVTKVSPQPLNAGHTLALARAIMNDKQAAEFERTKECNFAISPPGVGRFRVNAFIQQGKVGMVMRVIPATLPTIDGLGVPQVLKDVVMSKRGLCILVGATGSGKSTTLAAMVDWRNENSFGHIITIEDPVEFVHPHKNCVVTQREVGLDTDSWEAALKNTLRQAPDVILMGEVRDRETMEHAVAFAETGHLCLCTLHANSANQALDRIINFFPEERRAQLLMDLSLNMKAMISQRLVPKQDSKGCRDHAEYAADLRPDLQGRSLRDQGDHEEKPQPGHADLRPGAVRRFRNQHHHLRRRAAQRRLGQRPAAADQAQLAAREDAGSGSGHRKHGHHLGLART